MLRTILITTCGLPLILGCARYLSNTELYENAIKDVLYADESKIRPLVNLTPNDDNVIFNANGEVLMFTLHHFPDSYKEDQDVFNTWGDGWYSSVKEFAKWYKTNKKKFTDYTLRTKQLLGVSENNAHTHISSFYVNPNDLMRPAYEIDVTKPMRLTLPDGIDPNYQKWFNDNIIYSYYNSDINKRVPWTRLGYTYDWSRTSDRYGLSEFRLPKGHKIHVVKTLPIADFYTSYLDKII